MKIYLVGGAVRDLLLGLPVKERDWVIVGATVKDMLNLGYRQVGREFPVFLHPKTNEEYALARMERKTGPGYKGFAFDTSAAVTLEEDLIRRDLTINAMAQTPEGKLIDPYRGKQDLENKILRHVSPAFAEDPVRILRVGRFLARFAHRGFTIAPETLELMRCMTLEGEVDALVAERVWKELERALGEQNPDAFFQVLSACGALPRLFPGLKVNGPGWQALIQAATLTKNTEVRFAALLHSYPETAAESPRQAVNGLCRRYRVPTAYRALAVLTALHYGTAIKAHTLPAEALMTLFSAVDIFRREKRFQAFLTACDAIAQSQQNKRFQKPWLADAAAIAKSVLVQPLIAQGLTGNELANALKQERIKAVSAWLKES